MLQLEKSVIELDIVMDHIKREASATGVSEYEMRHPSGEHVLASLLTAKANALAALANLQH